MTGRWVKATFLAILGIIILVYADNFVDELKTNIEGHWEVAFPWTWDLMRILFWILVAWLFVDAALTVALSFSEHRYSLLDVMQRLELIEKKLGITEPGPAPRALAAQKREEEPMEEEVPPPPKE